MCTATTQPAQAARAWPCRGQPSTLSWLRPWPCRSPRSAVSQALVAVSWPQAPCRERTGAVSQRAVPRAWLPCPGLAVLYCDTVQPHSLAPCHSTPKCIVTQSPAKPTTASVTIQNLYRDTALTLANLRSCHDTTHCIVTFFPAYCLTSCNTICPAHCTS